MIISDNIGNLSPIFLSLLLIVYLIIVELGDAKTKKAIWPIISVFLVIFLIIALTSILTTYSQIK